LIQLAKTKYSFASSNRTQIADIKNRYLSGRITREEAQVEAKPVIECINKQGLIVAKKWKKKYTPQTFIGLMR
jgi:hypothetical protein